MIKRARIISLTLALAIFAAQPVQAEVIITPLDTSRTAQEKTTAAQNEQGTANTAAEPGQTQGQGSGTTAGTAGAGQTQNQGTQPGGTASAGAAGQAITSAGTYSTKEPVYLEKKETEPAVTPLGPGYEQPTEAAVPETSAAEEKSAEIAAPEIAAEAGILYDVTNDKVLYEKNADTKLYPASITKLMTALVVLEHAGMDETVTFSKTAVTNLESGAVTLKLAEGDQVSVKDCLYGLLLKSANEVANGLAEHVGGSVSGFADLMNAKAAALGCTGTHFVNPNGLNDPEHYTTARDMAKIAKAAFANPTLCQIDATLSYTFPATKNAAAQTITPGHKMLYSTDSRYYEGIVGGKTGYTSLAGNTLVTCVEKNGVRLIAVVLKAKSTQYTDTKSMLDYGYALHAAGLAGTDGKTASYHKWILDGDTWRFELADGTRIAGCLVTIDGVDYAFNVEGRMLTGWQYISGSWYCFKDSGAMVRNGWMTDAGKWFYLGADGRMVKNAWIDNQYYVGDDGVWVQSQQ